MTVWNSRYIYLNGKLVPYDEAKIHVQSGAVKYGGSVFEGLRAYWNAKQGELYVFRLQEHIDRLFNSLRLMRMEHFQDRGRQLVAGEVVLHPHEPE